jgi:hypothetical protein
MVKRIKPVRSAGLRRSPPSNQPSTRTAAVQASASHDPRDIARMITSQEQKLTRRKTGSKEYPWRCLVAQ